MLYICQYRQIIIHGAANKEECHTCGEKHPTGLHGCKNSKKSKDADGGN